MKILLFDTETTGLTPKEADWKINPELFPNIVSLSYIVKENDEIIFKYSQIIKPVGFIIPQEAIDVHWITNEIANEREVDLLPAINYLAAKLSRY